MKKIILALTIMVTVGIASAVTQYTADSSGNSYDIFNGVKGGDNGYIQINQDMTFSFTTDFGSVGGSGGLGFYTYTDNPANAVDGGVTYKKGDGTTIDLGTLSEGEKVGFYLVRNNGDIITDFYFVEEEGELYLKFIKNNGHGSDEMFLVSSIITNNTPPSGQPLPGVLAALLLGGGATYSVYRNKRKAKN